MLVKLVACVVCVGAVVSAMPRAPLSHPHQKAGNGYASVCDQCPAPQDLAPCTCVCLNASTASLLCDAAPSSCPELTAILSADIFPTDFYYRLTVESTSLSCMIEQDLWGGAITFQEIVMRDNQFQTVDNMAFLPFSRTLKLLDLADNSLRDIYFATLNEQPLLEVVLLAHNHISFLPGSSLLQLPKLQNLSLAYNKICQIQENTFTDLPSLRTLDLSHNNITKLDKGDLRIVDHQAPFFNLNLSYNFISYIAPGALEGVRTTFMSLAYNKLTSLPEDVFRPLIDSSAGTSQFYVEGNPFSCDTKFCWIVNNQTVLHSFSTIRCENLGNAAVDVMQSACDISSVMPLVPGV